MNKFFSVLLILLMAGITICKAQRVADSTSTSVRTYTLGELISIARENSIASRRAETILENRYWQFRSYRAGFFPQLSLDGTLPDFNRSVTQVPQPDGTFDFIPVSQNNSIVNLRLSQAIGLTGGEVFLTSSLQRFDNFETDTAYYSGRPVIIGLRQPLLSFNNLQWQRRIEPIRYEESKREYVENMEQVAVTTSERFFNVLLAQVSLAIAEKNLANNDTLFQIAKGRFRLGTIAENDLLQLELQVLKSQQDLAQARVDLETSTLNLRRYVGLTSSQKLALSLPAEIPDFDVDAAVALEQALENRQEALAFRRRTLEAERDVARARGENGFNADMFATFGLSNRAGDIPGIYDQPLDQQSVRIGFDIPIMDWGRTKAIVQTAEANLKLTQYTVEQDKLNFEQEIYTQVQQLQLLREQVRVSELADEIAQKRYEITKNRFLIGKIDITNLNIALSEKDNAKRQYIQSLRSFWQAYYQLRLLTLYDFQSNTSLYIKDAP
ncbi:TolC family protein [Roseivirga sp. BDSF3-8]|uniref:TolC family protein n=1 Tax=Roseivirga sp. BDSF3-8 TaxID=3241598 RepID=UPI0035320B89